MKLNRFLAVFIVVTMALTLFPFGINMTVLAFDETFDLSATSVTVEAASGENILITMSGAVTANTITVADDFYGSVTLRDLNISGAGNPISVQSGANVTFILDGANVITSTNNSAMNILPGANVTIEALTSDAADSLTATGAQMGNSSGAGIRVGATGTAAGDADVFSTLIIESGTITAVGGSQSGVGNWTTSAAGIGGNGGVNGDSGNIIINGGIVTAHGGTGGGYGAAGIGGGSVQWGSPVASSVLGDITINGGTVTAVGSTSVYATGAGIGTGGIGFTTGFTRNFSANITITGGTVHAQGGNTTSAHATNRGGGAGIGLGTGAVNHLSLNSIVIIGGDVTAIGGAWRQPAPNGGAGFVYTLGGAGIGSAGLGSHSSVIDNILLLGGTVTALGGGTEPSNAAAIGAGHHGTNNATAGNILLGAADIRTVHNGALTNIGGSSFDGVAAAGNMQSLIILPLAELSMVEYVNGNFAPIAGTPTFSGVAAGRAFWLNEVRPSTSLEDTLGFIRRVAVSANYYTADVFADFAGFSPQFAVFNQILANLNVEINPISLGEVTAGENSAFYFGTTMTISDVKFTADGYYDVNILAAQMRPYRINVQFQLEGSDPIEQPPEPGYFWLRKYETDQSGGIGWRIEGDKDEFIELGRVGQFVNGDWWVVGPVNILEIYPATVVLENGVRWFDYGVPNIGLVYMHGSMINPGSANNTQAPQAFDSRIYRNAPGHVDALNVGHFPPFVVPAGSSLVSSRSFVDTVHDPQGVPQLETSAVLTVLAAPAREGDFRPPLHGRDKSLRWNVEDLDLSWLREIERPTQLPFRTHGEQLSWLDWIDWLVEINERPRVMVNTTWTGRNTHPYMNFRAISGTHGIYGREIANSVGAALLTLQLDFTIEEKMPLLITIIQYGIDIYGAASVGGAWLNDGGHNMGRKMPLLLAATMLDCDDLMKYVTYEVPASSYAGASGSRRIFQDDNAITFITQAMVDEDIARRAAGPWPHGHGQFYFGDRSRTPLTHDMVGMPEWWVGQGSNWNIAYREIHMSSTLGHILTAHLMGLRDVWDSPATFDYADRFAEVEIFSLFGHNYTTGWRQSIWDFSGEFYFNSQPGNAFDRSASLADGGLVLQLWQELRPNISDDSAFIIYDQNFGLDTRRAEFSVRYIGEIDRSNPSEPTNYANPATAEITLVVQRFNANDEYVDTVEQVTTLKLDTAWTIADIGITNIPSNENWWHREPGMPHPDPLPAPTILRGPSTMIIREIELSEFRYEYFLQNEAGERITPIFHKAAEEIIPNEIEILSVTPNGNAVNVRLNRNLRNGEVVIVAIHGAGDVFLAADVVQNSSAAGSPPTILATVTFDSVVMENAETARVFLWESVSLMQPIMLEAIEVSLRAD